MVDLPSFCANAFFIIGAPKCGTTSLAKHLSEHPEISFADPKEPHFLSPDYPFGPPGMGSVEDYLHLFPDKPGMRCHGEGSVFYLYSDEAVAQIEELTEGRARYVVCLRDPVRASFSLHAQHVAFGWDPEQDYLAALRRTEAERTAANADPKLSRVFAYAELYRYAPYIRRLQEQVGQSRVMFYVMERDSEDLQGFYTRLHRFLRVSDRSVQHEVRVNEARRVRSAAVYRLLTSPAVLSAARLARRVIAPKGFGLKRPIRQITAAEEMEARAYFADDIPKTAALVDIAPGLWGGNDASPSGTPVGYNVTG